MRIMILWSGGIESTSLLKNALETSDDDVVAHHIRMHNPERRMDAELSAIAALAPELHMIRQFEYTHSEVSVCMGEAHPMDYEVQYPLGLIAMRHMRCQRLFRAGCAEDDWDHWGEPDGTQHVRKVAGGPGASHRRRAETLRALLREGEDPHVIAPYLDFYQKKKAWHCKYLGDLLPLTWSCRKPRDVKPCGICHSCLERGAATLGTSWIYELA